MAKPPRLRQGSRVAVFAPSGAVTWDQLAKGLRCLEAWGFSCEVSPHVFSRHYYLAGQDAARAGFLIERLLSGQYEVLWAARGGYGALRLLPFLDEALSQPPPCCWIIGFSDVSILLNYLATRWGLPCLHAPMVSSLLDTSIGALAALHGVLWKGRGVSLKGEVWRGGEAQGPLLGGNLTSLVSLLGTPWFPDLSGKILFLEEVHESTYRVDRLLTQLAFSGRLNGVKALVLGGFVGVDLKRLQELVQEIFPQGPILARIPCGHTLQNYPLFIGHTARISQDMLIQEPL